MQKPFDYRAELRNAREKLDKKLANYISKNPAVGFREVGKQFHLSAAAVFAIAKKYGTEPKRKRGRPVTDTEQRRGQPVRIAERTFFLIYVVNGKEMEMNLTVIAPKDTSNGSIRSAIERYFKCKEVKSGVSARTDRQAKYTLAELSRS